LSVRSGFTLVELLVVLVVMGLMVGLVAPAFVPRPEPDDRDSLAPALRFAREAALRRSEVAYLRIEPSGAWRVEAASSREGAPLAGGHLASYHGGAATLVVSPIGTCGFDARSAADPGFVVDPLTCEVRSGPAAQAAVP
jgi:prepilin-type N-terminal cleavage/methylation domain-containing protein